MKTTPIVVPKTVAQSIVDRLRHAIGVDPRGLDPARLNWILAMRCRHLELEDAREYLAILADSPTEIEELIDLAVVQETRFFRDPAVFEHIRKAIVQLADHTTDRLRILSAPCGTGEEAYSLAATLEMLGVPAARFSIDAFDISQSALAAARRGVYLERALSHVSPEWRQAVARHEGKHWIVHENLRKCVRFSRRNLAATGALGDQPKYSIILCRNLFIYLAPAARAALAQSLAAALLPEGRLFLGTADRVEELSPLFAPMRPTASFAFGHRPIAAAVPEPTLRRTPSRLRDSGPPAKRSVAREISLAPDSPTTNLTTATELLHRALAHHEQGETAKSERRCRQALYLAPNLMPALELLQSLWDKHPNMRLRRALRDRILRNLPERKESA